LVCNIYTDIDGWVIEGVREENEREVVKAVKEALAEEDIEDLSLSLIWELREKKARIRNGRTRIGPLKGPRGVESGAVYQSIEIVQVSFEREDELVSEPENRPIRGLLLESLAGSEL
jgi:hypothetical protein